MVSEGTKFSSRNTDYYIFLQNVENSNAASTQNDWKSSIQLENVPVNVVKL